MAIFEQMGIKLGKVEYEVTQNGTARLSGDKLTLTLEGQPALELTRVK